MPFPKFDRSKLKILPLEQRIHDVDLQKVLLDPNLANHRAAVLEESNIYIKNADKYFAADESVTWEDVGVKVTFTARAGGTVEAMPAYKNALMLTTEDLLEIMKNFQ